MGGRLLRGVWACGVIALLGCGEPVTEEAGERVPPDPLPGDVDWFGQGRALTGQDRIDFLRERAEEDLRRVLEVDPDHPGADEIRKTLADLDWQERQLRFRIANGFEGPEASYTEEEFYRRMIEDREMLELTDEQVEAVKAHLDSITARD